MMHKKIMVVGSLVLFMLLLISFSGCINQTEELDPTIQRIKDAGKLLVGTSAPYEPMEYIDINGDIVGFDIDIAEAIATALGVELEIKDMEFDDILVAVENGSVDISIAAITITVDRSEKVLFSNAYLNAGQVIIINETNEDIGGPNDLDNKTVGVQSGTTSEDEALKYTNSTLVKKYDDYDESLEHLLAGDLDAIVIDHSGGIGLIKDISGIVIVGYPFTDELYGVAMKKGEAALKTEIDKVIADMDIDSLENKWF